MKRYAFESCTQEQATVADPMVDDLREYWVRLSDGTINRWFERESWPKGVEFVRPTEGARLNWASVDTAPGVSQ